MTFNANGGTGTMPNQTASTPAALTSNAFMKDDYRFDGWSGAGQPCWQTALYTRSTSLRPLRADWTCLNYDPVFGERFTLDARRVSKNAATVQFNVRGAGGESGWTKFTTKSINDYNKGDSQVRSATVTSDTWGDLPPTIRVTGLDEFKKYRFTVTETTESGCRYESWDSNTISNWRDLRVDVVDQQRSSPVADLGIRRCRPALTAPSWQTVDAGACAGICRFVHMGFHVVPVTKRRARFASRCTALAKQ